MREILFRGKRMDGGEWVYGYCEKYCERHCICVVTESLNSGGFPIRQLIDVLPETVGQFTSLKDNNGNRIFEGDIVKTKQYGKDNGSGVNFNNFDIFEVIWKYAGYYLENSLRSFNLTGSLRNSIVEPFEVIGNVHDNPELLGGGESG